MEDSLTSQAIAELMLEIENQNNTTTVVQQERKVNPLGGKPNKNFLGRTINSALIHNRRESERTYANCQQKLQEMDDRYERRKYNSFYNRSRSRSRSRRRRLSSSFSSDRSRSRSRSRGRSRRRSKKKHKKKHTKSSKKHKKSKQRRRSSSCSSREDEERDITPQPSEAFLQHSKNMALAVAMAYRQNMYAQSSKELTKETVPADSSMSDIFKELMSDDEDDDKDKNKEYISRQPRESLFVSSSSDSNHEVLTINVDTDEDHNDESSKGSFHHSKSSSGSCISLEGSTDVSEGESLKKDDTSDLEIIEPKPEQQATITPVVEQKSDLETATVDLTDD